MAIREPFSAEWSNSMSLVEKVYAITREQMLELAQTIQGELKAECPVRSGEARGAIHIEEIDEEHIFVGGANSHLFFADQGNNQSMRTIRPVRAKALHFSDGTFHPKASTYKGKHFVKAVADRHR